MASKTEMFEEGVPMIKSQKKSVKVGHHCRKEGLCLTTVAAAEISLLLVEAMNGGWGDIKE